MGISALLKVKWFWYCAFCVLCWGPYAIVSKLGSMEIPAFAMQFLFTLGGLPVALVLLGVKRFKLEKNAKGILYGIMIGLTSGVGGLGLFAAFGSGGNTSIITAVTALYPMVTVILALLFLGERLTKRQVVGLGFATAAILIFSLTQA